MVNRQTFKNTGIQRLGDGESLLGTQVMRDLKHAMEEPKFQWTKVRPPLLTPPIKILTNRISDDSSHRTQIRLDLPRTAYPSSSFLQRGGGERHQRHGTENRLGTEEDDGG